MLAVEDRVVTATTETRRLDEIIWRKDLYPRLETIATKVQQFAEDIDVLPPIEVNQHNELIDGWHRWTAHRKVSADSIRVSVTLTKSDAEFLELAIIRNATGVTMLSQADKQDVARRIYHETPERERDAKKAHLARILSVSERTVRNWLSRIDKDSKEKRDKRILDLWLACYTEEGIAAAVGCDQATVARMVDFMQNGNLAEMHKPAASHLTDFEVPLYNVWRFKEKTVADKHFGNTEPTIVDNLLYLYTKPLDVVVDLFAGSGTTIQKCKQRWRRYFVSDRKVQPELAETVRQLDVTEGLPRLPWQKVRLVYLDPPYWKQAEGKYSSDPTDLANMDLETFTATLVKLVQDLTRKMSGGGYIALIIQPTQWRAPDRQYTDHVADLIRCVNLPIAMRYQCPYESQQANAQMVEWAKANRQVIALNREVVVWRVRGDTTSTAQG